MKILIGCEESQEVCKAFRKLGHEAWSCDILECSGGHPEWHLKMDVKKVLWLKNWDLVIAHPPCDRLANSGVRWLTSKLPRDNYSWNEKYQIYTNDDNLIWDSLYEGIEFFNMFILYARSGKKVAIENPIQHKYAKEYILDDHSQIIQPWQFGHGETKATCLWLYNLPKLTPTNVVDGRAQNIWKIPPSNDRKKLRSKTFPGIAKAMAEQWGKINFDIK